MKGMEKPPEPRDITIDRKAGTITLTYPEGRQSRFHVPPEGMTDEMIEKLVAELEKDAEADSHEN